MAICQAVDLTVEKVIELFNSEENKAVCRIYQPKGEEVYVFDTNEGINSKCTLYCIAHA
jgi:hypothetical protein